MLDPWRAAIVGAALVLWPVKAAAEPQDQARLVNLSIEELANLQVRSASKRDEPLSTVPNALYVITTDQIAASAATSLPEALRLAPNLQVQQLDAYQYAITARGFNGIETANKLLVLIDGRTVYTPLQSQVYWALHSPVLEDLRQIEVISGPGGTLYGPNAVNGVVNISSRTSQETIGTLLRATGGPLERTVAARHGLVLGDGGAIRFYANYFDREDRKDGVGFDVDDAFRGWQVGFRSDFSTSSDQFTLQGDLFDNSVASLPEDGHDGGNVLARWSRVLGPSATVQVQAYYDRFRRRFILVEDSLETYDVEAQATINAGRHSLVAGGGVRTTRDEFINNLNAFQLDPPRRRLWIYNAFVQDRVQLRDDVSLTAGVKIESSTFTGAQVLPNLRLAWQVSDRALWWAAVSRAVRTPSRIDRQLSNLPLLAPATEFQSEKLIAFEAGYRGQPVRNASLSVSTFFNLYDDIRTTELSPGGRLPIRLGNGLSGHAYGVEAWGSVDVTPRWRVSLGGTTLWKRFEIDRGRTDLARNAALGDDPTYQVIANTQLRPTDRLTVTIGARAVGGIDTAPALPGYVQGDARIGYRLTDAVELYVAGENILRETHAESNDTNRGQLAQRSLYAGTRLRF
jgi:iron complex outermembrane receptor protein